MLSSHKPANSSLNWLQVNNASPRRLNLWSPEISVRWQTVCIGFEKPNQNAQKPPFLGRLSPLSQTVQTHPHHHASAKNHHCTSKIVIIPLILPVIACYPTYFLLFLCASVVNSYLYFSASLCVSAVQLPLLFSSSFVSLW